MAEIIIQIRHLVNKFGKQVIHDHLDLDVYKGEIIGIVGGSGSGKTVLLNTIIGLNKAFSGSVKVFGHERRDFEESTKLQSRWGILYQQGALFSSLNVAENLEIPMKEVVDMPPELSDELVLLKLQMVGLAPETATKLPAELSGGMIKRVSLARALALDPELLFLDEPTSGLDPIAASEFDKLIKTLHKNLNLTVVMITHDLDTLYAICDRVGILVDKKIIVGTIDEMRKHPHPWIQSYFQGDRGRAAFAGRHGHKS